MVNGVSVHHHGRIAPSEIDVESKDKIVKQFLGFGIEFYIYKTTTGEIKQY